MADPAIPGARPHAAIFIFVTVVLDTLAMGMILPGLPRLIQTLGGGGMGRTALIFGAFATVFAIMQVLASPIQGALSDRFGRRPIILASNTALGLDYVIMALAPGLGWLFVGRLISGAAAGSGAAAYAYLADVTPPARRAQSFGFLFAAQALGAALGPALGGVLSAVDLHAPFWAAAALSLANALYGRFVLPESLPPRLRTRLVVAQLNPVGALTWLLRTHPALGHMVGVAFLLSLASQGANAIAVVYAIERYAWSPRAIGWLLTALAALSLAVQAGLVSWTTRRLGERGGLLGGLALTVVGLLIFGLAPNGRLFWLAAPFLALGALSGPMMAAYFSRAVGEEAQGRLQGAWGSINSLVGLVAPGLFAVVFTLAIAKGHPPLPGAPFFLAAGLILVAILLAARAPWPRAGAAQAWIDSPGGRDPRGGRNSGEIRG